MAFEGNPYQFENIEEEVVPPPFDIRKVFGNKHSSEQVDEEKTRGYIDRTQRELKENILSQELPVHTELQNLKDRIVSAIPEGMILLQGETGSGKSIWSPVALSMALQVAGIRDKIVMMQPRRDAASGIAKATAAVTDKTIGNEVGYSTSEAKEVSPDTALRVVTPGIFLRYLINGDLTNEKIGAVIIDELHEGSIDYHLALGILKLMRDKGDAPFIFLTSATIDKEKFQDYFGIDNKTYVKIEGRTYPVHKEYVVSEQEFDDQGKIKNYLHQTSDKVKEIVDSNEEGDILVFLPGAREIDEVKNQLSGIPGIEVLPLHGSLSLEDRDKAIAGNKSQSVRRVILSTNIAETSLTVPGIKIVVDSCRQRSVRYDIESGINKTGTEFISQSQAEQRAGRAGRLSSGTCYRMITAEHYEELTQHTESEITKINFSSTLLKMIQAGLDPQTFPFIEHPGHERIMSGIKELQILGALDENQHLTSIGEKMMQMPFEPRMSRMMVEAIKRGCAEETLILLAFDRETKVILPPSTRDIENAYGSSYQEKKKNARIEIQRMQEVFELDNSDLLKNIKIFSKAIDNGVFEAARRDNSPECRYAWKHFKSWCERYNLNPAALTHIAFKLQDYSYYAGIDIDERDFRAALRSIKVDELGKVILSGHPDYILMLQSQGGMPVYKRYGDSEEKQINISPGSSTFKKVPPLCISTHIVQGQGTFQGMQVNRNYASGVHPISLEEIEEILPTAIEIKNEGYVFSYQYGKVVHRSEMHMKGENYAIGEKVRDAEIEFPSYLEIRGNIYRVDYQNSITGKLKAVLDISPDELLDITQLDIPQIGPKDQLISPEIQVHKEGMRYEDTDVDILKKKIKASPVETVVEPISQPLARPTPSRFSDEAYTPYPSFYAKPPSTLNAFGNAFDKPNENTSQETKPEEITGDKKAQEKIKKEKAPESPEEVRKWISERLEYIHVILDEEMNISMEGIGDIKKNALKKHIDKLKHLRRDLSAHQKENILKDEDLQKEKSIIGSFVSQISKAAEQIEAVFNRDGKWPNRYKEYEEKIKEMALKEGEDAIHIQKIRLALIILAKRENIDEVQLQERLEELMIESIES